MASSKLKTPSSIGNNLETKMFLQALADKANNISVAYEKLPDDATLSEVIAKVNQIIETLNKL